MAGSRIAARPLLYQAAYTWLIFFAAMDVMMTWVVLHFGGVEVNALASVIIRAAGLPGMVVFKFATVVFVICLCEIVGRRSERAGATLARVSVMLTCLPVAVAFLLLLTHLR